MKRVMNVWMVFLLTGSLLGLSACSDDDPGGREDAGGQVSPDADVGLTDGGDSDTPPSNDGGTDTEDEPDACVPTITQCAEDMCGEIDNGCGEMLDCGGCPCEAGVVQDASCGTCGLGERTCPADETGFGSCSSPAIPGVADDADEATCEAKLIFVEAGNSAGDGTSQTPFPSYAEALADASAGEVIILGGQSAFEEALTVKKGVSVLGGFSSAPDFRFDPEGVARFEVPGDTGSDVFGIKAEGIDQETTLAQLEISTGDASQGSTNYGAYLRDASSITMRDVSVQAGTGGAGVDGTDGSAGADGGSGEDGVAATASHERSGAPGGAGGTNSECPSADGGDGGEGGSVDPASGVIDPASDGESTSGADGGNSGYDGGFNDSNARRGKDGQSAQSPGSVGANGDGGVSGGQLDEGLWEPQGEGVDGQRGQHGHGGGGGGGAYFEESPLRIGTGGAGGGAGGCGGEGGEAGAPGAGSFGLFLVQSDPTLTDSEFRAGFGGVGGRGGTGGLGGRGGNGSVGTSVTVEYDGQYWSSSTLSYTSGAGGDGSNGREGGHGGGGAGGVSYGAYCSQSRPSIEGTTKFLAGGSARGGQSAGASGSDGVSENSFGCE